MTPLMKKMPFSTIIMNFLVLSELGQWWGLVYISNIAVERFLNKMRNRYSHLQWTMSQCLWGP